ncbi:MAG: glycosyltransferase, partial [Candidatus Thorarchaeota archaeon]
MSDTTNTLEQLGQRDERFAAGLPKILVCSDSAVLPTGLARVVRGIFDELHKRNNFAIVQHGWFHTSLHTVDVSWPIIPVRRNPADERFFATDDKFGQKSFDSVVEAIHPDIVFVVGDYGTFDHILNSTHRSTFQLVAYIPLDCFPPNKKWVETARKPDRVVFYTDFAKAWAAAAGVAGPSVHHGVDTELFCPASSDERATLRKRLFDITPGDDTTIVGTVGRVQPRKRLPIFIEAIAHVKAGGYSTCLGCNQISLHQYDPFARDYIGFQEMETCPRCKKSCGWTVGKPWPKLKGYLHADPKENQTIPLDALAEYWGLQEDGALLWNPGLKITQSQGISDTNLIEIYQSMDLYMHPACGGGCELPNLEAASCGIPIIAADAPAQNEYIAKLHGSRLISGDVEWDFTSSGYRVFTHVQDMASALVEFLESDQETKDNLSIMNRESAL